MKGKYFLIIGGICCFAIFLLHVYIAYKGEDLYRYFGAGERMAQLSQRGSVMPGIITIAGSFVFAIMGLYAFSGAQLIRQLPFLRLILAIIGSIFTLRGLMIMPQIIFSINKHFPLLNRFTVFSLVSLLVGLLYSTGVLLNWNNYKSK
jgi:hypothetical protein